MKRFVAFLLGTVFTFAVATGCSDQGVARINELVKIATENGLEYRLKLSGPTKVRGVLVNGVEGGTEGWLDAELVSSGFVPQGQSPESK